MVCGLCPVVRGFDFRVFMVRNKSATVQTMPVVEKALPQETASYFKQIQIPEKMKNNFEIFTKLPTLNEYIEAERTNRYSAASMKKRFTLACQSCALSMDKLPNKQYDVSIIWHLTNKKTDPDNIAFGIKFILDGVVASGKLPSDGMKNIRHIEHRFFIGKQYSVKVNFFEVDKNDLP